MTPRVRKAPRFYKDRQWLNPFPGGSAEFRAESSYDIDLRTVWLLKTPF
jgi:hypothetical protein